jgi:hypothetical protein
VDVKRGVGDACIRGGALAFQGRGHLSATADHRIALRGDKPVVARWHGRLASAMSERRVVVHHEEDVVETLLMDLAASRRRPWTAMSSGRPEASASWGSARSIFLPTRSACLALTIRQPFFDQLGRARGDFRPLGREVLFLQRVQRSVAVAAPSPAFHSQLERYRMSPISIADTQWTVSNLIQTGPGADGLNGQIKSSLGVLLFAQHVFTGRT